MRLLSTLIILLGTLMAAGSASAICLHTSVKGLDGRCLDRRCPPGTTAYMATIENSFPEQLYITYAFRRPDGAIITAGLTLDQGVSRLPIGIGPVSLPVGEGYDKRLGRLRILECGIDPAIIFKWRRK
jgi:hypothetical protein